LERGNNVRRLVTPGSAGIVKRIGQASVVVASILIAFALDALWEESKERRDLHDDLANIALELEENRARVVYHLDMAQRMANALDVLYVAIDTDGPAPLVADTTVWLAHITPTMDASLGAIDALIASGRMAVVENPELSRRLAGLRGRVEDAVEEQLQALQIHFTRVLPELDDLDHQATRHISDAFWSQERVPGRELEYRGKVVHPGGATLLTALSIRHTLYTVTIGELRDLVEELDLIEELVESEVGGV
jgi:hypothetical protein